MAERLCNHFASYRAATDLFLMYLDTGRSEEAKFLVQVPYFSYELKYATLKVLGDHPELNLRLDC